MHPDSEYIREPLGSLSAWAGAFRWEALPVLGETVTNIERLRLNEDEVDAHGLADVICRDPFMTVKLFAQLAHLRAGREDTVPETVTGCLLMLGIPPFFARFRILHGVEDALSSDTAALEGLEAVLTRSRRSADFALAFAVHRMDQDAQLIHSAALLHEFAEMLLWLKAPQLAAEIVQRQRFLPQLRSVDAQRAVLRVSLPELQHELMVSWHVPQALASLIDPERGSTSTQAHTVDLATRVARHSAKGWDNPAIPDDVQDISELLQIGLEPTKHLLAEIDS
jgi:HD-like signal output (HDOD) protein